MLGCLRYDYTCCSRIKAPHLPFSCEFNDNETLASYANGIYDYYDVEQIEEFVAFMGVGVKTGGSRVGGPELCVKAGW